MSVSDYQSFMRPLLAFGADGQEKNINAAIDALADEFHITPEDRQRRCHYLEPLTSAGCSARSIDGAKPWVCSLSLS